jgi:ABC-type glycerol-3-phosphate transport system permease component
MRTPVRNGLSYALLLVVVLFVLAPLVWLYLSSVKNDIEMYSIPPTLVPHDPSLRNYGQLLIDSSFTSGFLNSVLVALGSTAVALLLCIPAAYAFSRYLWRGLSLVLFLVLVTRMFPPVIFSLPYFIVLQKVLLINTRLGLGLVYLSFQMPLAIWLLDSFFRDVPKEIEEAARVDGLSRTQILLRIVIPLSLPGLAVAAIFAFLLSWNEFLYALILTRTSAAQTIPVVVSGWISIFQILWGKMTAAAGLYVLPALLFISMVQRGMLKGLMKGGVKQ